MTFGWVVVFVPVVALLGVITGILVRATHSGPPDRPTAAHRVDKFGYPAPSRPSNAWPQTVHVWHHMVVEHHVAEDVPPAVRGWIDAAPAHPAELPARSIPEVRR